MKYNNCSFDTPFKMHNNKTNSIERKNDFIITKEKIYHEL
jgi:hypothetical protein